MLKSDPRLKVIHLKRKDKLRSVLSWMIARDNNAYTATSDAAIIAADDKRQSVDPDELIDWVEKTIDWEVWGDTFFSDRETLEITYEDMTADMPGQFGRALDYLGLPAHSPQTRLRRQNPEPVEDLIGNWPEVREQLLKRGYGRFVPV